MTTSVIQQQQQFCLAQVSSRNLFWNATRLGLVARQPCPEGAVGRVSWLCDVERQRFLPLHSADFSQCQSIWLNRLAKQLDSMLELPANKQHPSLEVIRQQNEQMLALVLGELSLMARTKELYAEDLKRMDIMISQILAQLKSLGVLFGASGGGGVHFGAAPNSNNLLTGLYEELFTKLVSILSSLFDWQQRSAWLELASNEQRRRLELRLVNHLKESGLLLANSMSAQQIQMQQANTNKLTARQPNVAAALSTVIPTNYLNNNNLNFHSNGDSSEWMSLVSTPSRAVGVVESFEETSGSSTQPADQQTELRMSTGLAKELLANGMSKFLIIDVRKPDYALVKQQLELQLQQQVATSTLAELSQSSGQQQQQQQAAILSNDLSELNSRLFGVFGLIGDSGLALGDLSAANSNLGQHATVGSSNKQQEVAANKLNELISQWPISVEFKTNQQSSHERQCSSLGNFDYADESSLSSSSSSSSSSSQLASNRCQLTRSNGTHFVCTCDRFGFISLAINGNSPTFNLASLAADFQWPPSTPATTNNPDSSSANELEPRQPYESPFIQSTSKVATISAASPSSVSATVLVSLTVCLLIFALGVFVAVHSSSSAARRAAGSHSRLGKKQASFLEALNGLSGGPAGPTTGPLPSLTTEHNLMGSDPLVSGTGAHHSLAANNNNNYKAHNQQLYAAAHLSHSSYSATTNMHSGGAGLARRLTNWLWRPSRWLATVLHANGANSNHLSKERSMIHHRVLGASSALNATIGNPTGTLAYKASQCHPNGYTTSIGLYHPTAQQQQQQRQLFSNHQPLNSSSNSSYVSSSAYYEEIGPGNLTKVNTSQLSGPHTTIVDPFKGQANRHHQQQQEHHYHWQQQQAQQVAACTLNSNNNNNHHHHHFGQSFHQQSQPTANRAAANSNLQHHTHNDLSPLQSSSASSSAGSQHSSAATSVTNAPANSTPRHYLFASPSAVNAYKQQQQFRHHQ